MEGWLEKRYPLRSGRWQLRWCELRPTALHYFEEQADGKSECGWIAVGHGTVATPFSQQDAPGDAAHHRTEKPFGFVLVSERNFYFSAPDEASLQKWLQAFKRATESRGARQSQAKRTVRLSVLDGLTGPAGGGFQSEDSRPVWQVYEQEARLGSGAFGTVYRARERDTGREVALKQVFKSDEHAVQDAAVQEFMHCAQVAHPHVLRVYAFFNAADAVYIACELAANGELLDFLASHRELAGESSIAGIAAQVLAALVFLHGQGMVHHDVKPQNILVTDRQLAGNERVPCVVLSDFGTARLCQQGALGQHGQEHSEIRGTPEYCGPEVFEGRSGDRTDVYAMGVTLFELLAGEKPFEQQFDIFAPDDGKADDGRFQQMRDLGFEADWSRLRGVSGEGSALVRRMMAKAYAERPSALECAEDAWLQAASELGRETLLTEEECQARSERLLRRASQGFYAKALMNMMATQVSGSLLQKERTIFRLLDVDKSGSISVEELLAAFGKMGLSQERAATVMRRYDIDRSGSLGFNEWLGATMFMDLEDSSGLMARVQALFSQLDADGSGSILLGDLQRHFGDQSEDSSDALEAFFNELDTNKDGSISLEEFTQFWKRAS